MPRRLYLEVAAAYQSAAAALNQEVAEYHAESSAWYNVIGRMQERREAVAAANTVKQAMLDAADRVRDEVLGDYAGLRACLNCITARHELDGIHYVESTLLEDRSDEALIRFFDEELIQGFFYNLATRTNPPQT